jgi:hypothetical protein
MIKSFRTTGKEPSAKDFSLSSGSNTSQVDTRQKRAPPAIEDFSLRQIIPAELPFLVYIYV